MKTHVHDEQFDGVWHAACGRVNDAVSPSVFEATDPRRRCRLCDATGAWICPTDVELAHDFIRRAEMKALFYFAGYNHKANAWWRFAVTVPDGPHDRYAVAKDMMVKECPELRQWSGRFVCLTPEDVFKEL